MRKYLFECFALMENLIYCCKSYCYSGKRQYSDIVLPQKYAETIFSEKDIVTEMNEWTFRLFKFLCSGTGI